MICARPALPADEKPAARQEQPQLRRDGQLDERIKEASGLVASRRQPGVLWTVSDSGHPPNLYAVNRQGKLLAQFRIANAVNFDWESLAIDDDGHLYIADVGNNLSRTRFSGLLPTRWVYRIVEPEVPPKSTSAATEQGTSNIDGTSAKSPGPALAELQADKCYVFSYGGPSFDIEATFVSNQSLYLIAKSRQPDAAIYRLSLTDHKVGAPLEQLGTLPGCTIATGADLDATNSTLAVCSYDRVMIWQPAQINSNGALQLPKIRPDVIPIRRGTYESITFINRDLLLAEEDGSLVTLTMPAGQQKKNQ